MKGLLISLVGIFALLVLLSNMQNRNDNVNDNSNITHIAQITNTNKIQNTLNTAKRDIYELPEWAKSKNKNRKTYEEDLADDKREITALLNKLQKQSESKMLNEEELKLINNKVAYNQEKLQKLENVLQFYETPEQEYKPYEITKDDEKVIGEIKRDYSKVNNMDKQGSNNISKMGAILEYSEVRTRHIFGKDEASLDSLAQIKGYSDDINKYASEVDYAINRK